MNNKIYFPHQPVLPVKTGKNTPATKNSIGQRSGFEQLLDKKLNETLKFSNHAQERMKARNIELSDTDMNKLVEAVGKAREKGSKDSLILMKDLALVVSVKNNTVITAVDSQNLKENIFTNIDSAIVL
ncbi:MAG: flagellar protein [Firmicutes bacterium HGW-Firmicutes-15]|nr:MAG: flagellar protein [Firmicutes bacterium HGW-Firmicutes-15]